MRRVGILLLGIATLCLASSACRKLSPSPQQLKIEPITSTAAISAEYGNLVAVTSTNPTGTSQETWALLWFEKPDKSIVVVSVSLGVRRAGLANEID
jgi:hypothetical protein